MRLRVLAHIFATRLLRVPRSLTLKRALHSNSGWIDDYKGFGIVLASRRTEIHTASFSVTRRHDDGTIEVYADEGPEESSISPV